MREKKYPAFHDLRDCGNVLRRLRIVYSDDDGNADYILRRAAAACEHYRRRIINKRIFSAVDRILHGVVDSGGRAEDTGLSPDFVAGQLDAVQSASPEDAFTLDELCAVPDCIALSVMFALDRFVRESEAEIRSENKIKAECDTGVQPVKTPGEYAADTATAGAELLRDFEEISFERFLEKASETERALLADKRGIYPRCDHDTKQLYRKAASDHARRYGVAQREAAELILARRSPVRPHRILRSLYFPIMYVSAFILAITAAAIAGGNLPLALLVLFPLTELTRQWLDFMLSRWVRPGAVPRFELKRGDAIPETLVVITTLLFGGKSDGALFDSVERCYHANKTENGEIAFGILADLPDASSPEASPDAEVLAGARERINALNKKYGGGFYLFSRGRTYSATEERYMGRERKRGALLELADLSPRA